MIVRSFARTDVGRKRAHNEDAYLADDDLGIYFVADGMGGHAAGEVASSEAVSTAFGMVKTSIPTIPPLVDPVDDAIARSARRAMESAIQAATYMVFTMAELDRNKSGMGTTMSGIWVHGDYAITGQVGDSRIYQVRDGVAEQLTEDHTLIAYQLREGLITLEEARRSPHRNVITRAVGNREYVQVDTGLVRIEPGDRYLLCSDGLHGYLRAAEIPDIVDLGGEQAVEVLVDLANERGGKDNITAVVVEIE